MSPLRQRMIGDMTMRKLASKTQQHYIQIIKNLAVFLGRSPDTASFEDIRRFQLHVAASGVGVGVINRTASALRFFFIGSRSGDMQSSSTRTSFMSPASCRWCSVWRR